MARGGASAPSPASETGSTLVRRRRFAPPRLIRTLWPPPPSVAEPKSGEEDSEDSDDEDAGSDDGDKVHLGWEDEGYD